MDTLFLECMNKYYISQRNVMPKRAWVVCGRTICITQKDTFVSRRTRTAYYSILTIHRRRRKWLHFRSQVSKCQNNFLQIQETKNKTWNWTKSVNSRLILLLNTTAQRKHQIFKSVEIGVVLFILYKLNPLNLPELNPLNYTKLNPLNLYKA